MARERWYSYKAVTQSGQPATGKFPATSLANAIHTLELQNLSSIEVESCAKPDDEIGQSIHNASHQIEPSRRIPELVAAPTQVDLKRLTSLFFNPGRSITSSQKAVLLTQLSAMFSAGIPLVRALTSLIQNTGEEGPLSKSLRTLHDHLINPPIEKSTDTLFVRALNASHLFTQLELSQLAAAEAAGQLDSCWRRLATDLKADLEFRHTVQSALLHPAAVALLAYALLPCLLMQASKVQAAFTSSPTLLSRLAQPPLIIVFWLTIPILVLRLRKAWKNGSLHKFLRFIPPLDKLHRDYLAIRVGRALSQMLESGVPLIQALELSQQIGWPPQQAQQAIQKIRDGETLSQALQDCLPPVMLDLVRAGEESGKITSLLRSGVNLLDVSYQSQLDAWLKVLEPLLIIAVGLLVAILCAACLLPIIHLVDSL